MGTKPMFVPNNLTRSRAHPEYGNNNFHTSRQRQLQIRLPTIFFFFQSYKARNEGWRILDVAFSFIESRPDHSSTHKSHKTKFKRTKFPTLHFDGSAACFVILQTISCLFLTFHFCGNLAGKYKNSTHTKMRARKQTVNIVVRWWRPTSKQINSKRNKKKMKENRNMNKYETKERARAANPFRF